MKKIFLSVLLVFSMVVGYSPSSYATNTGDGDKFINGILTVLFPAVLTVGLGKIFIVDPITGAISHHIEYQKMNRIVFMMTEVKEDATDYLVQCQENTNSEYPQSLENAFVFLRQISSYQNASPCELAANVIALAEIKYDEVSGHWFDTEQFPHRKSITGGQFVAAYTDRINKLTWSKALPGQYTNSCVDANDKYDATKCKYETGADGRRRVKKEDSIAEKACRTIGAKLPTKQEFESLIKNFDHREDMHGFHLTEKGIADMQTIFGDLDKWFWSSSAGPEHPYMFIFNSGNGVYDMPGSFLSIRCVKE